MNVSPPVDNPVEFRRWLLERTERTAAWLDDLLTPAQVVAQYPALARSAKSLANQRAAGRGPRYVKAPGSRTHVFYRRHDILRHLEKNTTYTTDDPADLRRTG